MNPIDVMILMIISAAVLFLISSILVSKLFAIWIRMDAWNGNFNSSRKKIQAFSCVSLIAFSLVFGTLFSSVGKFRVLNLSEASFQARLRGHENFASNANVVTAVLAALGFDTPRLSFK